MIVLCISSLAIITKDLLALFQLLIITILISLSFGLDFNRIIKPLKRLFYVIVGIALVQSIFSTAGRGLISLGGFNILTTYGVQKGLEFILRMMIIIFSATLLASSNAREIIQGFVQWGMPYELAFMVATGIRFLPIMTEEVKDSLTAIQLRGIDLNQINLKKRLHIYSYLFSPIILGSLWKAEKLSMSIEMRAFRAYDKRTSYMTLKMSSLDYLISFISIVFTLIFALNHLIL